MVTMAPIVPPRTGLALVAETVGGSELAANTCGAIGTRKMSPEIARSARIVPELNFVTYAFVSVFIIFKKGSPSEYIKGVDKSSIFAPLPRMGSEWRSSSDQTKEQGRNGFEFRICNPLSPGKLMHRPSPCKGAENPADPVFPLTDAHNLGRPDGESEAHSPDGRTGALFVILSQVIAPKRHHFAPSARENCSKRPDIHSFRPLRAHNTPGNGRPASVFDPALMRRNECSELRAFGGDSRPLGHVQCHR